MIAFLKKNFLFSFCLLLLPSCAFFGPWEGGIVVLKDYNAKPEPLGSAIVRIVRKSDDRFVPITSIYFKNVITGRTYYGFDFGKNLETKEKVWSEFFQLNLPVGLYAPVSLSYGNLSGDTWTYKWEVDNAPWFFVPAKKHYLYWTLELDGRALMPYTSQRELFDSILTRFDISLDYYEARALWSDEAKREMKNAVLKASKVKLK